jgi:hypothetical protein
VAKADQYIFHIDIYNNLFRKRLAPVFITDFDFNASTGGTSTGAPVCLRISLSLFKNSK